MSISYDVLGPPGGDNAAYVRIDSGQALTRLLFDCGANIVYPLGFGELQAVDLLLFSHLHMDHIGGFDSFFRANYSRPTKPNRVFGPPGSAAILQHRFQGFLWNLEGDSPVEWQVGDVYPDRIAAVRFRLREAFAVARPLPPQMRQGMHVLDTPNFSLDALEMDHRTPSLAYIVREKPRVNVDEARLRALALPPGPWLQQLKTPLSNEAPTIAIAGQSYALAALREALLTTTGGMSLAYCTDFLLDDAAHTRLVPALHGCDVLICECQYRADDAELAARNYHMTAPQVARLALEARVGQLILFHISDRYRAPERQALLAEAQAIFPATQFPTHWNSLG